MGLSVEREGPIHEDFVQADKGILVKTGDEIYQLIPTNYDASVAPTASDNFSKGWKIGSEWSDGSDIWKCVGDGVWNKGEVGAQGVKGDKGDKGDQGDEGDDGAGIIGGSGSPSNALGLDDDFFIDTLNMDIYGPKTGGLWGSPTSIKGDQGDQGADGRTWLSGTNTPGSGVGEDGDFFFDTANKVYYGPKASGVWPSGVSIVGPAGAKGDQGDPGPAASGLKDIGFYRGEVESEAETDQTSWQTRAIFIPKNSSGNPMALVGVWSLDWYCEISGNLNSSEPKTRVRRVDAQEDEELAYHYWEPENGDKDWESFSGHKEIDFGNTPTTTCFYMDWANGKSGGNRTSKIRRVRFKLTHVTSSTIYNSVVVGDGGGFSNDDND